MKEVYGTMALDTTKLYTTDDIETLPEGVRAELYDGKMIFMEAPSLKHQDILGELLFAFKTYQKSHHGTCKTIIAPCAVHLSDQYNYLEPDLIIVCPKENDTRIQEKGIYGAPDFVLEIVSPSTKRNDYYFKLEKYLKHGVREYWIVDPEIQRITVHYFEENDAPILYTFQDNIPVNIYENCFITFKDLDISN